MDYYKNISKNLGEALKSIPLIEKISDYGVYICGVSLISFYFPHLRFPSAVF
jgi:hypothetical protein